MLWKEESPGKQELTSTVGTSAILQQSGVGNDDSRHLQTHSVPAVTTSQTAGAELSDRVIDGQRLLPQVRP